jgi:uncharacterized membrane protein YqiK
MIVETILIVIIAILAFIFVVPGFALVRDNEVGIVTRKMFGQPLPQGKIIAINHGEVGVQADHLMPGMYWRFP